MHTSGRSDYGRPLDDVLAEFGRDEGGTWSLTSRYLYGPAVDQLLAAWENASGLPLGAAPESWPAEAAAAFYLADHLGSVRQVVDGSTGQVAGELVYDSFGNVLSESNAEAAGRFKYTAREWFDSLGLQYNRARWYDPALGRWLSPDPIGFAAGDANLYRYLGNSPTNLTDPSGLSPWKGIAEILGKKWTAATYERAGKELAKELLQKLGPLKPSDQKAQEIIKRLKGMGWVETAMQKGDHAGQGMILWEMENGQKTGRMLEWHPGGGHHGPDPHWKFSSGESGTLRYLGGTVTAIAVAAIPGVAQAQEGDWNGAARDMAIEFSPLAWAKMGWQALGSFFDACERDLYGEDYHREMEKFRKEYWEKKK